MNKKGQVVKTLFFVTVVVIVGTTFFMNARDYGTDQKFYKDIAVNEIKLAKDAMGTFQGVALYKFHLNVSDKDVKFYKDYVQIDKSRRTFLSETELDHTVKSGDLYFFKSGEEFKVNNFFAERYLDVIDYADVGFSGTKSVDLLSLKEGTNLDLIKSELVRSFEKKEYTVNKESETAITIIFDTVPRKKNITQAFFAFDKNELNTAKSRKLGALILNQILIHLGSDITIKPVRNNAELDKKNVAVIIELEEDFLQRNVRGIPSAIEKGVEEYFGG